MNSGRGGKRERFPDTEGNTKRERFPDSKTRGGTVIFLVLTVRVVFRNMSVFELF